VSRLIVILLVVSAAVGLALLVQFNEGNVAILWPPYRVDLSINLLAVALFVSFVAGYALLYTLFNALSLPQRVRDFRQRRSRSAAIRGLRDGLVALFEGRFGRAERLIKPALSDAELAGPAALVAARAAQRLNDARRVEEWLDRAEGESALAQAVLLSRAELALEERDAGRALEAVAQLHAGGARHIQALRVALRAHELSGQWRDVLQVVRQLDKRDALHPSVARSLKGRALRELFNAARHQPERLDTLWQSLTFAERQFEDVAEIAAPMLAQAGRGDRAADMLLGILSERFEERLVRTYAGLIEIPARERLRQIEILRDRYGEHAALSLAAGRLCAAVGLWGKAEEFLRRARNQQPGRETTVALARLLEQLGHAGEAQGLWREAALDDLDEPLPERPIAPINATGPAVPPQLPDTPSAA
jgi:HemY protein